MAPTTNNSTWVTPRTWTTGELVTASIMNTHLRDNFNALHVPAGFYNVVNRGTDITTTSTSFAALDATELAATVTTGGGDMVLFFICSIVNSGGAIKCYFDIHESVSGARIGGDDGIALQMAQTSSAYAQVVLCCRATGLTAAAHTFTVQAKVASGTMTIPAGAGTSTLDIHPVFWGYEI